MKTPQRNFVVEFKSGRRRSSPQSTSIWGNTDLKALVRKAERDAPHLFDTSLGRSADNDPAERQHTTDVTSRILESTAPDDAQPAETSPAETPSPVPTDIAIVPPGDPVLRPKTTAQRRVRPQRDDRAPKISDADAGKTAPAEVLGPGLAKGSIDDLAVLEDENRRLRSLLSQRLHQQNRQLRQMLVRFDVT